MIQRTSIFSERIAIRLMRQVISAVLYCHINGIVHRDIKSDKILFLTQDINSSLKLIDFGISIKFEKDTKLKGKTGTILYIAPEVISGSYDEKCDIWSCGVLMYMMLCGLPPFDGNSRKEVMAKIIKGKFAFKSKIWNLISAEAKDLISMMLTLDPQKRPSCREVLSHPWFSKDESGKINNSVYLDNMSKYEVDSWVEKNQSQLIQAILTFITTNIIQHQETKELEVLFKKLDTNQDGKLSQEELTQGFKKAYPHYDDNKIESMVSNIFSNADSNFSGSIDYTEYLISAMSKEILLTKDKMQKAFQSFDIVVFNLSEWRWVDIERRVGEVFWRTQIF